MTRDTIRMSEFPVTDVHSLEVRITVAAPHLKNTLSIAHVIGYHNLNDYGLEPLPDPHAIPDNNIYELQECLARRQEIRRRQEPFLREISNKVAWAITAALSKRDE